MYKPNFQGVEMFWANKLNGHLEPKFKCFGTEELKTDDNMNESTNATVVPPKIFWVEKHHKVVPRVT